MANHTHGIQQLLAAEKRAAEKVADAEKRKARRLKQAKEETQNEIEKYRLEREKRFKEFEAKHIGSREDVASRIDANMKAKIDEMTKQVNSHKKKRKMVILVYNITPELHKNFKAIK